MSVPFLPGSDRERFAVFPLARESGVFLFLWKRETLFVNNGLAFERRDSGPKAFNISLPDSFPAVLHPVESAPCNPGPLFQGSKG